MFKAILNEHQNAANSDTKFVTSNYGLEVCPRKELEAVLNPEFKPKPVYPGAKGRRQWQNVGTTKPTTGRELSNSKLATELQKKQDFTPEEWDSYGIAEVHQEDFIMAGDSYFKPAENRHQREIVPFRVYLSAAGCLDEDKWKDPELETVLLEIKEICGPLDLTPEDQVRIHAHILALYTLPFALFCVTRLCRSSKSPVICIGSVSLDQSIRLFARFARPWYLSCRRVRDLPRQSLW